MNKAQRNVSQQVLRILPAAVLLAAAASPGRADAAVPSTLTAEGLLNGQAGAPVADGQYPMTFIVYKDEQGGLPVWQEGPLQVQVKGGAFAQVLGSQKPVDAGVAASGGFMTVKIGAEPELPRKPWRSVPFALRSQVAEGLVCSGCVDAAMLNSQLLSGYAKVADLGSYAKVGDLVGYAKVAELPKVAGSGQYGDLQGLPVLAKVGSSCGTGLFVKGIKADGALDCGAPLIGGKCNPGETVVEVKADGGVVCAKPVIAGGKCQPGQVVTEVKGDGTVVCNTAAGTGQLAPDGLSAVSNGLLTNVFDEVYASSTLPKTIPDNNPGGILDEIVVPETGIVKEISISLEIAGQDLSGLVVTVFDPLNNAYVLHSKSGPGSEIKTSFPVPTKLVSGDLSTWVGKNPKGTWRLVAADWQAGGSAGQLVGWAVKVKVLSTTKVAATKDFLASPGASPCYSEFSATGFVVVRCGAQVVASFWGQGDRVIDAESFYEYTGSEWQGFPWELRADGRLTYKGKEYGPFRDWVAIPGWVGGCGLTLAGAVECVGKLGSTNAGASSAKDFGEFSIKPTKLSAGNGNICAISADGEVECQSCATCPKPVLPTFKVAHFHASYPSYGGSFITVSLDKSGNLLVVEGNTSKSYPGVLSPLTDHDFWLKLDGTILRTDGKVVASGFSLTQTQLLRGASYFPCGVVAGNALKCMDVQGAEITQQPWYPEAKASYRSGTLVKLLRVGYLDVYGNRHL